MKQILSILIAMLGVVIFTSNTEIDNSGNQGECEIEIIAQTLPELLHPIKPPPPPPFVGSEKERKEFNDSIENIKVRFKHRVDTTLFAVHLFDKLVIPDKSELKQLQDSMYNGLAVFLLSDTLSPKSICITAIDSLCQYKLLPERPQEFRRLGFAYLGSAIYSRIVFNESFTSALFYFERYFDEDDGSGHLILVEKQNGKWIIKRDDMIWIS